MSGGQPGNGVPVPPSRHARQRGLVGYRDRAQRTHFGLSPRFGVAHLTALSQLEQLDMKHTRITQDSLPHLIKLKNLREFNAIETRFYHQGGSALQRANPRVSIAVDAPP